jgi:hypothetical protein
LAQALDQLALGAGLGDGAVLGEVLRVGLGAALEEGAGLAEPLSGAKPSCRKPASRTGSVPARAPSLLTATSGCRPLPWIQTLSGVSQRATVK